MSLSVLTVVLSGRFDSTGGYLRKSPDQYSSRGSMDSLDHPHPSPLHSVVQHQHPLENRGNTGSHPAYSSCHQLSSARFKPNTLLLVVTLKKKFKHEEIHKQKISMSDIYCNCSVYTARAPRVWQSYSITYYYYYYDKNNCYFTAKLTKFWICVRSGENLHILRVPHMYVEKMTQWRHLEIKKKLSPSYGLHLHKNW